MPEPTHEELTDSIEELMSYRDRLQKEVISISQKLRIPNQQINSTLENHPELEKVDKYIEKLIKQRNNQDNSQN
tara:strand:+ start:653 stop:874 length:222 start_codon:yes stop_codon:yes gene_type:complete